MTAVALVGRRGLLRSGVRALFAERGDAVTEIGPERGNSIIDWWDTYGPDVHQAEALRSAGHCVCLIEHADELPLLERVTERAPNAPAAVIVPSGADELSVLAVGRGACAVLNDDCDPAELFTSVTATLNGAALVPLSVARSMADTTTRTPTGEELGWLRELAIGQTVAKVARNAGFAERSFYRRLGTLYDVLGVSSRTEALLEARRQGLL